MKRTRIKGRKLGASNGESFNLTTLGKKEQSEAKIRSQKKREHHMIKMVNQRREDRMKEANAIKALDAILASQGCSVL